VDPDLFVPGCAKLKYAELYLSRVHLSNKKEISCPRPLQSNKKFFSSDEMFVFKNLRCFGGSGGVGGKMERCQLHHVGIAKELTLFWGTAHYFELADFIS
jgi:hypothetical protein